MQTEMVVDVASISKKLIKHAENEDGHNWKAQVWSPQRSAALCESAAAALGVSSLLASLLLPSLVPSPRGRLRPLYLHRQASSGVGLAGPHWLLGAPGFAARGSEREVWG